MRVGEIIYIDARGDTAVIDYRAQFFDIGHTPIVEAAELSAIGAVDQGIPIVVVVSLSISRVVADGADAAPSITVIFITDAAVVGFHFPDKAGYVVLDARPLGGASGKEITIAIELGEGEAGVAIGVVVFGGVSALITVLRRRDIGAAIGVVTIPVIAAPVDASVIEGTSGDYGLARGGTDGEDGALGYAVKGGFNPIVVSGAVGQISVIDWRAYIGEQRAFGASYGVVVQVAIWVGAAVDAVSGFV